MRAAGLPGPSHWGPRQRGQPLALRAADPPFGAAGNWQTSCTPALRLSWSRRPGSPAENNTASSLLPFRGCPALSPGSGLRAPRSAAEPSSRPGATKLAGREPEARTGRLCLPTCARAQPPPASRRGPTDGHAELEDTGTACGARPPAAGTKPLPAGARVGLTPAPIPWSVPTPGSAAQMGREISGRALPIGPGEMWAGKSLGELCRLGGRSGRPRGEHC